MWEDLTRGLIKENLEVWGKLEKKGKASQRVRKKWAEGTRVE